LSLHVFYPVSGAFRILFFARPALTALRAGSRGCSAVSLSVRALPLFCHTAPADGHGVRILNEGVFSFSMAFENALDPTLL